jgi:hypothetical protein
LRDRFNFEVTEMDTPSTNVITREGG